MCVFKKIFTFTESYEIMDIIYDESCSILKCRYYESETHSCKISKIIIYDTAIKYHKNF